MDVAFVLIEYSHELFLANAQTAQNKHSFVPVLANIAENGLGKVLDHVLGLRLLSSSAVFVLL